MFRLIFGNENAEKDYYLQACKINPVFFRIDQKPILTGKWGTGKTASLLLDNNELSEILANINPAFERLWYIDEASLSIDTLVAIRTRFHGDNQAYIKALEQVWKAEIIRRACLLLYHLSPVYTHHDSSHWDFISKIGKKKSVLSSIWEQLPNALKLIKKDSENGAYDIQKHFRMLFTDDAFRHLQHCLADIADQRPKIVVAVEPIETPTSAMEEHIGLAQGLIVSLLNTYQTYFQPDPNQLLEVRISIPWHRYITNNVDFPQKIGQYIGYISWSPSALREFINRRIEWEFGRVRRSFTKKGNIDAWLALFDKNVRNDICEPAVVEDSFSFVCRHTHHRPRDLQRVAREAVELFSRRTQKSLDDILSGTGGVKVSAERIKQAVRKIGLKNAEELINESARRYSRVREFIELLKGISVPFSMEDLTGRLNRAQDIDTTDALKTLWTSGVIGIEVAPNDNDGLNRLKDDLPSSAYKYYRNLIGAEFHRWYLFDYSWNGDPYGTYLRYINSKHAHALFIIHPKMYFYIVPSHAEIKCPLGA